MQAKVLYSFLGSDEKPEQMIYRLVAGLFPIAIHIVNLFQYVTKRTPLSCWRRQMPYRCEAQSGLEGSVPGKVVLKMHVSTV